MASPNNQPLPTSFDEDKEFFSEAILPKLGRRLKEEPLIPLGCAVTVWAVVSAARAMRRGDHKATNMHFRHRLYAHSFTLACVVVGSIYWKNDRMQRKEYKKYIKEKERVEKRARWLKELELRDEEEKAWNERMSRKARTQDAKGVTALVAEKTQELKDAASKRT